MRCILLPIQNRQNRSIKDSDGNQKIERPKNVLANAFQLREIVREIKPDVIHSFSRLLYLYPMFISGTKVHVLRTYGRAISQRSTDMARRICGKYIHFACCGAHMLKNIKGYEDWNVVYNFTDTDYFKAPDIERKYLVFLGRIEDIKGTHEAIMVAKKSNTPLIIAGNIEPSIKNILTQKLNHILMVNLSATSGLLMISKNSHYLKVQKHF